MVDCGLPRVPALRAGDRPDAAGDACASSRAAADQRRGRAGRTEPGVCYRLWDEAADRGARSRSTRPRSSRPISRGFVLDSPRWGVTDPAEPRLPRPAAARRRSGGAGAAARASTRSTPTAASPRTGGAAAPAAAAAPRPHGGRRGARPAARGRPPTSPCCSPSAASAATTPTSPQRLDALPRASARGRAGRTRGALAEALGRSAVGEHGATAGPRRSGTRWTAGRRCSRSPIPTASPRRAAAAAVPARQRPRRGVEPARAGARAVSRGRRDHRQRPRGRILLAAPIARGRDRGRASPTASSSREDDVFDPGARACAPAASAARRLVLAEGPIRAEPSRRGRAAPGAGDRAARARPAALDESARAVARPRRLPAPAAGDEWPDLSDAALAATADALAGAGPRRQAALAGSAPTISPRRWTACCPGPCGGGSTPRRRRISRRRPARRAGRLSAPEGPALSIRVQELFGLDRHPAVAGGRVPLVLDLLSPAHRPIQITRDLPGFWRGSWAAVEAEMKGRYPAPSWPDDPLAAPPTSRAKPRGE